MKKTYIFIGGIITGVVLLFVILIVASLFIQKDNYDIVLFDSPTTCISTNNFKVMQVLDSGAALANEFEDSDRRIAAGITVLFLSNDEISYYDDQIITIPNGKCAKQIGYFKYRTKGGSDKTVPVVKIMDK